MNIETTPPSQAVPWTEADHYLPETAADRIASSQSENTLRARRFDWDRFIAWCEQEGRTPLPATDRTLAAYTDHLTRTLTSRGTLPAPSTVERALSSISSVHTKSLHSAPTSLAYAVLKSYREQREDEGFRVKRADTVSADQLRKMSRLCEDTVIGVRDRMILLLAFYLLARRSEMTRIRISDVVFTSDGGMDVRLVRTKTDKKSAGQVIHISPASEMLCAVAAVKEWLEQMRAQGIEDGLLVRQVRVGGRIGEGISDRLVDRIVKKLAAAAGVDRRVSGHTLRRSPVTHMAEKGVPMARIARRGGWRSNIVHDYVAEDQDRFNDPMSGLGSDL